MRIQAVGREKLSWDDWMIVVAAVGSVLVTGNEPLIEMRMGMGLAVVECCSVGTGPCASSRSRTPLALDQSRAWSR